MLSTDFNILQAVIWIVAIFLSIAFHEYAHGWMASILGDDTAERSGRLTLNPIAHIDLFGSILLPLILVLTNSPFFFGWAKPVPYNPNNLRNPRIGGALVAAAGPGANFLIAIFAAVAYRILGSAELTTSLQSGLNAVQFFGMLSLINISLAVFNLIPIPPLDGSKLLALVLPGPMQRAFDFLERVGPLVVFVVLIFAFNILAPFVASIVFTIFRVFAG